MRQADKEAKEAKEAREDKEDEEDKKDKEDKEDKMMVGLAKMSKTVDPSSSSFESAMWPTNSSASGKQKNQGTAEQK